MKKFIEAELEIKKFNSCDIITTSPTGEVDGEGKADEF